MGNKFRKAADGGNLIVFAVAIGILAATGLYLISNSMTSSTIDKQVEVNNALNDATEALKNS